MECLPCNSVNIQAYIKDNEKKLSLICNFSFMICAKTFKEKIQSHVDICRYF